MDIETLKRLAGITGHEQMSMKSVEQEIAERRRETMRNVAPVLSKENVDYHYKVLSAGYVNRYNNKEGDPDFNYGGAKLHNLFWQQFKPAKESSTLDGPIEQTITANYGDLKGLTEKMVEAAMTIQGSGWVYMTKTGTIKTTPNQSFKTDVFMPIDMWEHSFMDYVPAKDAKKKYIESVMKLMDWDKLNRRLEG